MPLKLFGVVMLALFLSAPPAFAQVEVGQKAPEFEAVDVMSGKPVKLSDYKGQLVVLEWSNHECPFVRKHYDSGNMQKTQKAAKEMGGAWITVVSSAPGNQGHVSAEEAKKIAEDDGASISAKILDEGGKIGNLYGAKTTPHMYVINAEGTLVYTGAIDSIPTTSREDVEKADNYVLVAIEELKAGNPVSVSITQPYGCSIKY